MSTVSLFVVVLLVAVAYHLWRRRERLLALIPAVLAFELAKDSFPVVSTVAAYLQKAVGLSASALASLAGALLLLVVVAYAFRRLFANPSGHVTVQAHARRPRRRRHEA